MFKRMLKLTAIAGLLAGMTGGCLSYKDDRCVVPEAQYTMARNLFQESGSLDLVRRQLVEMQWRSCRVNEAIYRLQKEFEVTAPTAPLPSQPKTGEGTARPRSPQS